MVIGSVGTMGGFPALTDTVVSGRPGRALRSGADCRSGQWSHWQTDSKFDSTGATAPKINSEGACVSRQQYTWRPFQRALGGICERLVREAACRDGALAMIDGPAGCAAHRGRGRRTIGN